MTFKLLRLFYAALLCVFAVTTVTAFVSPSTSASARTLTKFPVSKTFLSSTTTAIPKVEKKISVDKDIEKESDPKNSKGWAIRLYNDPMNKREFVARCLTEVCSLTDGAAYQCMMKAHQAGIAVVGEYHLEMAELYRDQLTEHGLMIDMVPVDDDK